MNQQLVSLGCLTLLASCGAGTVGIAAAADDSSSSGNAPTSIGELTLDSVKTPDALITIEVADAESNPTQVELFYEAPGKPRTALATLSENPVTLTTSPDGESHTLTWDFPDEQHLPDDAHFVDGVVLMAEVVGGSAESDTTIGLGNDPPVVTNVRTPIGVEAVDIEAIPFDVQDSSDDVITIRIEYNADAANAFPESSWQPARPGGLSPGAATPDPAFTGIEAPRTGRELIFFWDTNHLSQLQDLERDVKLRFTPEDEAATGVPFETPAFSVDNNDAPIGNLEDGLLTLSADETRGIAIPYTVIDEESDPVRVVFQWRQDRQPDFPPLPISVAEIEGALENRERRAKLQICTEMELSYGGTLRPAPAGLDPATHVSLPELASTASSLLAIGVEGLTLEILRASRIPESVSEVWERNGIANPFEHVVAALPVVAGPTALVLESSAGGSWRLREIDLADGTVVDGRVTSGFGTATAMDFEPGKSTVVVASAVGGLWQVQRVDPERATVTLLITAHDGETELGPIRDIAALGTGAALITVGNSLIRLDYAAVPTSEDTGTSSAAHPVRQGQEVLQGPRRDVDVPVVKRAVTLLDDLSTPWGVVTDPLKVNRIYLAERDFSRADGTGRVSTLELDTYLETPLAVVPGAPGLGFESPTSIALERNGARLLVVTDSNPGDASKELRAANIGGAHAGEVYELTSTLPFSVTHMGVGPESFRLLASEADLLVGGGVLQRRTVLAYDPSSLSVSVSEPMVPPPPANAGWRIAQAAGRAQSSPGGHPNVFVWDSADALDGFVHLRLVPLDTDVGLADEGQAPKRVAGFEDAMLLGGGGRGAYHEVADVDDDGRWDLVAGRLSAVPESVELYLSKDDGGFQDPKRLRFSGLSPGYPAAGDLTGDGLTDVVVSDRAVGWVGIFRQPDPDAGGWQDANSAYHRLRMVDAVTDAHVADLDRDGDLDVVAVSSTSQGDFSISNEIGLFFQSDTGFDQVRPNQILDPHAGPGFLWRVESADLNQDGLLDLAIDHNLSDGFALQTPGELVVYFQKEGLEPESWGFEDPPDLRLRVEDGIPTGLALADLDDDGRLDVAWNLHSLSEIQVHFQHGRGVFVQEPDQVFADQGISFSSSPFVGDFNRDGRQDLATAGLESDAIGFFLRETASSGSSTATAVFDGLETLKPVAVEGADLNGDGLLDLVAGLVSGAADLAVIRRKRMGGFSEVRDLELGTSETTDLPQDLAAGDFDGDGLPDLVSANGQRDDNRAKSDTLTIFLQDTPGAFAEVPDIVLGGPGQTGSPRAVVAVDVNGDGALDVASANDGTNDVTVFFQAVLGGFANPSTPDLCLASRDDVDRPKGLVAADLDGDGWLDLATANRASGNATIFHQMGAGLFEAMPEVLRDVPFAGAITAGDLDADGQLDLVVAGGQGELVVFYRRGSGFAEPIATGLSVPDVVPDRQKRTVVATDLDLDGRIDLVENLFERDALAVLHQGEEGFQARQIPDLFVALGLVDRPNDLVVADFNGDGWPDLASANTAAQTVTLFPQWGRRVFAALPTAVLRRVDIGDEPAALLAADLNADGEPDLATGLHRVIDGPSLDGAFDVLRIFFNGK